MGAQATAALRPVQRRPPMTSANPSLTIGELEANYSLYCKALRLLLLEGRSLARIQRTLCWERLAILHSCLPNRYRAPDYLAALLRREIAEQAKGASPAVG